ncbi:30S ribosomal protein S6e [Candidatus Micrarchaeota archaeon CG1_02_51_15]|nr:MAG: 30S ribosomal protein S6e [Candidatus Micrarchaeota archaeon CG1_02_51_15]
MKIVIADCKTGNCFQKEVEKTKEAQFAGKKIGDDIEGGIAGLPGYTLTITGGSDKDGFPMRHDIDGQRRVKAYLSKGAGIRHSIKGVRRKRTVTGNKISANTVQLNAKIKEYGQKPLAELGFTPKAKEKKAEAKEEKK